MSELTVKELAAKERVTERTVRRWIDKGAIVFRRTPGGGIRIPQAGAQYQGVLVLTTNEDVSGHPSH